MKITVYNFKGGTGKTSIALNLALTLDYGVVTNDVYSPLEKVLPDEAFLKIRHGEVLPDFPEDYNIIFDLGGHVDTRAVEALKQSKCVLVPVTADFIDLQVTIDCIGEIEAFNRNIGVVGNRTVRDEFETIKETIGHFYTYPIFELKKSKALPNVFRERKSVRAMVADGGLKRFWYQAVADQFDEIIKFVEE